MFVLHVSQSTDYGVAGCVAALAADQIHKGWNVTVACPPDGWLAQAVVSSGAAHESWEAGRQVGPSIFGEAQRLRAIIASVDPSVVHLHSSKAGLVGRSVIRGRRPTLFHTHAWSFLALEGRARTAAILWERWAARWATAIVCCSAGEADQGRAAGVDKAIVVVPNAVDLSRFPAIDAAASRSAARAELGFDDAPLAVCIARLAHQKGQDILLSAWPAVREAVPRARLVLVGEGPERRALSKMMSPGVELVGHRTDIPTWLAAADVVTLPSRYDTMPLTLLEAMACGRSVVVTDVPGVAEALQGAESPAGAIVALGDVNGLAAALAERLAVPVLRDAEGAAARRHAEATYGLGRWLDRIEALTQEVTVAQAAKVTQRRTQ